MQVKPTILVVEDEVLIRMAFAGALCDEGYEVIEAASANEALTVLSKTPLIQLVITDINMPGTLDGIGLAIRIKEATPRIPVMVVSSTRCPDLASCVDAFLPKPVCQSELILHVERLIAVNGMKDHDFDIER